MSWKVKTGFHKLDYLLIKYIKIFTHNLYITTSLDLKLNYIYFLCLNSTAKFLRLFSKLSLRDENSLCWSSSVETELFVSHKVPFNCSSSFHVSFQNLIDFSIFTFSCIAFCFFSFTVLKHFLKLHTIFKQILNRSNRKLSIFYSIQYYILFILICIAF